MHGCPSREDDAFDGRSGSGDPDRKYWLPLCPRQLVNTNCVMAGQGWSNSDAVEMFVAGRCAPLSRVEFCCFADHS